jgi:Zn-dependent oligopeptidase
MDGRSQANSVARVWTPAVLEKISWHFSGRGESLPEDLIQRLIKSRFANKALFYLRQRAWTILIIHFPGGKIMTTDGAEPVVRSSIVFYGKFDMLLHTSERDMSDLTQVYNNLLEEITLASLGGYRPPGHATFAHIAGGYDAGYCGFLVHKLFFPFSHDLASTDGYLYSEVNIFFPFSPASFLLCKSARVHAEHYDGVCSGFQAFAADMFAEVFAKDPLARSAGLRYREQILKPGGSRYVPGSLKTETDARSRFQGRVSDSTHPPWRDNLLF